MSITKNNGYAVLVLRLGLGVLFVAHAGLKLFSYTLPGTARFFEGAGIPGVLAYPVFAVELIGGLLLIIGLYTRWAALSLVPVMIGATLVLWPNGWVFSNAGGGWEFTAFLAAAALGLFLQGEDGAIALGRPAVSR